MLHLEGEYRICFLFRLFFVIMSLFRGVLLGMIVIFFLYMFGTFAAKNNKKFSILSLSNPLWYQSGFP